MWRPRDRSPSGLPEPRAGASTSRARGSTGSCRRVLASTRSSRQELEERYGPEYEVLLKIMGELRAKIIDRGQGPDENRKIFETLVGSDILEHIRKKQWKKVEAVVKQLSGVEIDISAIRQEATSHTPERKGSRVQGPGSRGK